jgi:hypothetical protein
MKMIASNRKQKKGLFAGFLICFIMFSCENQPVNPSDQFPLTQGFMSFKVLEKGELVEIVSIDGGLILSIQKDNYAYLNQCCDFARNLRIKTQDFTCQYDEKFSNILWIIDPSDITFPEPMTLKINYTHEEFSPDFSVQDLVLYQLKRDYISPRNDQYDQRMFRLSDMKIVDSSRQIEEDLTVLAEINQGGSFVLGRKMNIKGEIF